MLSDSSEMSMEGVQIRRDSKSSSDTRTGAARDHKTNPAKGDLVESKLQVVQKDLNLRRSKMTRVNYMERRA
jgi:hypothetical protein